MPERLLAQDIVAMSREPLLVLDERLTVLAASRSFGAAFDTDEEAVVGSPLVRIANGRLNIPLLTEQLLRVLSGEATVKRFRSPAGYRVRPPHVSASCQRARPRRRPSPAGPAHHGGSDGTPEDRGGLRRRIRRANDMLVELNHRAMNSFAMIGAILTMEARLQQDDHCRAAFARMRARITSIAHLYRNLGRDHSPEAVGSDDYSQKIVNDLITSLGDPTRKVDVSFSIDKTLLPIRIAVPVGLIVNEIVTNSLKHAFTDRPHGPSVSSSRETDEPSRAADCRQRPRHRRKRRQHVRPGAAAVGGIRPAIAGHDRARERPRRDDRRPAVSARRCPVTPARLPANAPDAGYFGTIRRGGGGGAAAGESVRLTQAFQPCGRFSASNSL